MKFKYLILCFLIALNINAQDTVKYWNTGGLLGLNVSQISLINWAGGGKNTLNLAGITNLFANYTKENVNWTNSLELGYGLTKLGGESYRKSDDKIIAISTFNYKANEALNYSALLDFRTQFYRGFKYESGKTDIYISNFMSPAFLSLGLGMNYKPNKQFEFLLAPLSNRILFVFDDSLSAMGAFGVEKGKNTKIELGASMNMFAKFDLVENVTFQTRLSMFAPYNQLTLVVINSETLISMKVNSFLNVNLNIDAIYDDKVPINRDDGTKGPATQFRNVLAIGFSYKI